MIKSKNPTIKDVARAASVSIASASRALNGINRIAPETKERVLEAARLLQYVPHEGARSLITRKTQTIGVLLPDLYGEFFSEIIRGIDEASRQSGYQILLSSYHNSEAETARAISTMRGRVDGLLVMAPYSQISADGFHALHAPIVMLNEMNGRDIASVSIDSYQGGYDASQHLVKLGYINIAHLSGPNSNLDAAKRKQGYMDAMEQAGQLPIMFKGDFTEECGHKIAQMILEKNEKDPANKIDAVFAANDMMAIGLCSAFIAAQVKVPEEIAIIGFDDIPISKYIVPTLTTMRVNMAEIGRNAFEILIAKISGKKQITSKSFVPELVIRQSCPNYRGTQNK